MTDYPQAPDPVELTDEAIEKAVEAMEGEGLATDSHGLRVGITGGGCAGLQYLLDFHELSDEREYDFVYKRQGLTIVVDCFSAMHLTGTTIEYADGLSGSGFKFINPNITRRCGCGSSVGY